MDKRKLGAAFAVVSALTIGLMSGGGGDDPVAGSYRGGYYAAEGSYGGSSAPATWDTLTIVLTMDKTMVHYSPDYNADVAAADTVYELGTDLDFAYTHLRESDEDGNWNLTYLRQGIAAGTWEYGTAGQYVDLLRPDFSDVIALDGSYTVLDAELHFITAVASVYTAPNDTFCVSLLDDAADSLWYDPDNFRVATYQFNYYASASWNYQLVGTDGGASASFTDRVTSTDPWSFDNLGGFFWDLGAYHDMVSTVPDSCGYVGCGGASYVAGNVIDIPFPVTAQAILNGETYSGLALSGRSDTTDKNWRVYGWETNASPNDVTPWITIQLVSKRYLAPFPAGKRGAFVFNTDDEVAAANIDYAATLATYGGHLTTYVREDNVGISGRLTWAQLKTLYDAGNEIGSHSRWHNGSLAPWGGLNYWNASDEIVATDYTRGMAIDNATSAPLDSTTTSTQWDYLLADTDPVWLYSGLVSAGASLQDLQSSGRVGVTFAAPLNQYNPASLRALDFHGYRAMRGDAVAKATRPDSRYEWRIKCQRGDADTPLTVAECDTGLVGRDQSDPTRPRNMIILPVTVGSQEIVGDETATPSEKEVRRNIRRILERALATQSGVFSLFTHDFKTGGIYANGIDSDEFGWICSVADSLGFWMPSVSEYEAWAHGHADAVDTPPSYSNVPKFAAVDKVWFKPWRSHYGPK